MILVVCSQLLHWGQLWELQGMKSEMGALDLEPGKCCLTSHHSFVCYTATFTGGNKNYLCYYTIFLSFFPFIFISWRLITLQYCSGFCHTVTWISHGFTCVPHPNPPSHLPLHRIPLGLPSDLHHSYDSLWIHPHLCKWHSFVPFIGWVIF